MTFIDDMKAKTVGISLIGVVLAVLVAGYLFKSCQRPDQPKIPPKIQKTIDSLDTTKPDFDTKQDSLRRAVVRDTMAAERYKAASKRFEAAAGILGARADSLAKVAAGVSDSATAWHKAYDARTLQVGELEKTVAHSDSAYQRERDARLSLSVAYGADTLRRIAVEKLNTGLRKTIDELERPCKFARFIPCPSRTTTAVVSAIGGAVAGHAVK